MHLWCGGDWAHRELERIIGTELADSKALILDMRDGYGGNLPQDLDCLYRKPSDYPILTFTDRAGKRTPTNLSYNKPVVALINSGSRSGKEILAFNLKTTGRAKLIGERTAGFVLGGGLFPIDDRSAVYLPVQSVDIGGVVLEGKGVEPDILMPDPNRTEAAAQAQLERAKEELHKILQENH